MMKREKLGDYVDLGGSSIGTIGLSEHFICCMTLSYPDIRLARFDALADRTI